MSVPRADPGIVVGVDGSPASDLAVGWAARDAAMRNVALTRLIRVNRGAAVWCWMALAVIGGCRPTVRGGVDSRVS